MRADERQTAAAYTYAWWLTGEDDVAVAAIRAAFDRLGSADERGERPLTVLMQGVREHLGDVRPMCPASELALLHDGLDVELGPAAELAAIPASDVTSQLAHGRLEGLLETVREDFDHPERLGGLAVGNPPDIAHARQCPSCARARTLVERGRNELREVVAVSAPAGLLAGLIAGAPQPEAPPAPVTEEPAAPVTEEPAAPVTDDPAAVAAPETGAAADVAPPDVEAPAEADTEAPTAEAPDTEAPAAGAETDVADVEVEEPAEADELPPTGEEFMQRPALLRPEPAKRQVPTTPARKRTAGVLAGVGLLVLFALVTALFAMGSQRRTPAPQAEQPAMGDQDDQSTPQTDPGDDAETEPPSFGPDGGNNGGFSVAGAGLLRSGGDEFAAPGAEVDPNEPLRLAVDYRNAVEGVPVSAVWRVDGEPFLRLRAVLAGTSSRHVWGLPVPPEGWPPGAHRVLITTEDGLAAAIHFRVSSDA